MPVTINGDGSITGLSVGGLGSGVVNDATLASNAVTTAKINDNAVTAAKIANTTITNAQISGSAAIAQSKIATGNLPSGITVNSANINQQI